MHVLIDDGQGLLTMRRLWPWQRILARSAAARLDSALARGAPPKVALVTELLVDGTGPLYRKAAAGDLTVLAARAVDTLTW